MDRDTSHEPTAGYVHYALIWAALVALLVMTIAVARLSLLANYSVLGSLFHCHSQGRTCIDLFHASEHEGWVVKECSCLPSRRSFSSSH